EGLLYVIDGHQPNDPGDGVDRLETEGWQVVQRGSEPRGGRPTSARPSRATTGRSRSSEIRQEADPMPDEPRPGSGRDPTAHSQGTCGLLRPMRRRHQDDPGP